MYLNQQIKDNVQVKEIIQDSDLKYRLQKRNEIYEDMTKLFKFEENNTKQLNKLVFMIESKIHKLFKDVYVHDNSFKNYHGLLINGDVNMFNKMSELYESKFLCDILFMSFEDTAKYDYYIATAVLNIYISGVISSFLIDDTISIDNIIFVNFKQLDNGMKIRNRDRFLVIKKLNKNLSKEKSFSVEKSLHKFSKHIHSYNMLLSFIIDEDLSNSDEKDIAKMYMINSIKETYDKKDKNNYWENYLKDYQNYVKSLVDNFTPDFLDIINDVSKDVEDTIKIVKKIEIVKIVEEEYFPASIISKNHLKLTKNNLSLKIVKNFSDKKNKINEKDIFCLNLMDYDQLEEIYDNLREEPEILKHIPIQYAKNGGVYVFYDKMNMLRFVVGGTFPEFEIVYRYRHDDGKVYTELERICSCVGIYMGVHY
jgi:hypothetical protein